ncbi:MAG TPA: MFS transporter [Steroidobacteraceae bacterium]|nr:MFS transporter [Steroidobacteraceae bacterium]
MSNNNATDDTGAIRSGVAGRVGNYRWVICALLFFCTTINYVDRNSLSVLKTTLQGALGWNDVDYAWITFAFTFAYAAFPSPIGVFVDRFGVKKALAIALILWSFAAAGHGLVATVIGFIIMRFILGVAEAANFPASIKAVAMWFPQKERALATGIFNSGTSVGVMVSWGTVAISNAFGWQAAFVCIGAIGLIWLYFWQVYFDAPESSKRVRTPELEYIRGGQPPAEKSLKVPWTLLLRYRDIWPFLIGKLITDPVWWFYLFWLPSYLENERDQPPLGASIWIAVIYLGSTIGSVLGGWLSSSLIKRGWPVGKARMTAMFIAAACMPASVFAYYADSLEACVAFIALATGAHQAWSANLFTSATDLFPQKVSGSVVGLGATAGGIGGMFMTLLVGLIVQWTGNQQLVFIWAGAMHLASLGLFWWWFHGRFTQVDVDAGLDTSRTNYALTIGGALVAAGGALLGVFVMNRWDFIVSIVKFNGALGAATVAGGFVVIGLALIYAGLPRRNQVVAPN